MCYVCCQIIPNVLKWLMGQFNDPVVGMKWSMLLAGLFVAITVPIGIIFLRPITLEQLHAVEAERKRKAAAKEMAQQQAIEMGIVAQDPYRRTGQPGVQAYRYPYAITSEPKAITSDNTNRIAVGEMEGANNLVAHEKLLAPVPAQPQATPVVEDKKKLFDNAAASAYFKYLLFIVINPRFLILALNFAVIMTVENIFLSITFGSFLKVCVRSRNCSIL